LRCRFLSALSDSGNPRKHFNENSLPPVETGTRHLQNTNEEYYIVIRNFCTVSVSIRPIGNVSLKNCNGSEIRRDLGDIDHDSAQRALEILCYVCVCVYIYNSEFLATDPEVLGSNPGASRFSEKRWVWNGAHSAS
jgi:hypothetical protein